MKFLKNREEEKMNSITHAFGAGYAFSCFLSSQSLEVLLYSLCVGIALILSTLYHGTSDRPTKDYFRMLDMISIHVVVAVTCCVYMMSHSFYYICLLPLFVLVASIVYTIRRYGDESFEEKNVLVYIATALVSAACALYVLISNNSIGTSAFVYGLILYSAGLVFYVRDGIKWFHTVWHVFVLVASYIHFEGILKIVSSN